MFIVGALIIPKYMITLKNIALNKSRIAFIDVIKKMGGKIKVKNCRLYTYDAADDTLRVDLGGRRISKKKK